MRLRLQEEQAISSYIDFFCTGRLFRMYRGLFRLKFSLLVSDRAKVNYWKFWSFFNISMVSFDANLFKKKISFSSNALGQSGVLLTVKIRHPFFFILNCQNKWMHQIFLHKRAHKISIFPLGMYVFIRFPCKFAHLISDFHVL